MGRRRRRNSFNLDDIESIVTVQPLAVLTSVLGVVGIVMYYAIEPPVGEPTNPISMLSHMFWEAVSICLLWPSIGLLCLGLVGVLVTVFRRDTE